MSHVTTASKQQKYQEYLMSPLLMYVSCHHWI